MIIGHYRRHGKSLVVCSDAIAIQFQIPDKAIALSFTNSLTT
ncbi:hypothetical protein [Calothrix sp. NIES-2100]